MQTIPSIPQDADVVYVIFSAYINPNTSQNLIAAMSQCVARRVKRVDLLLSTPGGSVSNGINLYNVLRAMPFDLTVHNVGNIDSIGNAIFLAGKRRYASPPSTFMFHGVGFDNPAGQRLEEKNLRESLNSILADQKRIGTIIAQHTSLSPEEIEGLFRESQTKDAEFAMSKGFISEIREANIPTGSSVVSLVFQV